jgi:hypothetical protein
VASQGWRGTYAVETSRVLLLRRKETPTPTPSLCC